MKIFHSTRKPRCKLKRSQTGPRITDFFSNSTDLGKHEESRQLEYHRKELQINSLESELNELKVKYEESERLLSMHKKDVASLTQSYENIVRKLDECTDKTKRHTIQLVMDLERRIQIEEFTDLALKKQRYGYMSMGIERRDHKEWIDGVDQLRLLGEKDSLEKEAENLTLERKSIRTRKRKDDDENRENMDRIKCSLYLICKRLEEVNKELESSRLEKFDIFYRERRINEAASCYFSKPKPDQNLTAWPLLSSRYQVLSLLGKGGFAEVYKAYDLDKFRYVAIKVHHCNAKWNSTVRSNYMRHTDRENRAFQSLSHANIVKYFDTIAIDDMSYGTILEYCECQDLDYLLKKNGSLPEKDAKVIIKQLLSAVKYLNEQDPKIIHYDLKPQNILFTKNRMVKITDFGLCKLQDTEESKMELTSPGVGTYWYLPPECFESSKEKAVISSKVDIWSMGVIMFQILYGKKPFGNDLSQDRIKKEKVILRITSVVFPEKPNVSGDTKDFIKKCLTYEQNERIDVISAYNLFNKLS